MTQTCQKNVFPENAKMFFSVLLFSQFYVTTKEIFSIETPKLFWELKKLVEFLKESTLKK